MQKKRNFNNADQVIPRLWLGNLESSQDINFIKNKNIDVIINCTKDLPFLPISGIYKYRVPVNDDLQKREIQSMCLWIEKILPIINYHYQLGRTILIHCYAGIQRSAIIVLCYLCQYHFNRDRQKAFRHVKSKRKITFTPVMNFYDCFVGKFQKL